VDKLIIGVIGPSDASPEEVDFAYELGRLIAKRGFYLLTGGGKGVMEAASKGAVEEGGETIGILPTKDKSFCNPFITIPIRTGLGEIRNFIVVFSSDGLIAIGLSEGTLSELSIAVKLRKPLVGFSLPNNLPFKTKSVKTPPEAIEELLKEMRK